MKFKAGVSEHGIVADDIWNMDETGFQIGVGKDQMVVTKQRRAHYFSLPTNCESATAVEAISAAGRVIPVFFDFIRCNAYGELVPVERTRQGYGHWHFTDWLLRISRELSCDVPRAPSYKGFAKTGQQLMLSTDSKTRYTECRLQL